MLPSTMPPHRRSRRRLEPRALSRLAALCSIAALGLGFGACGSSETQETPPPLCYVSRPIPDGGFDRALNAGEWIALLTRGGNDEGAQVDQDCIGNSIRYSPIDDRCDVHDDPNEPAPEAQPLDGSEVVQRPIDATHRLVWVITHHYENGDGLGPVGYVERNPEGLAVRAMGMLRAPRIRPRLRLQQTGGMKVLVAAGEICTDPEDRDTCTRSSHFMPMVGDRFVHPELRSTGGHCYGPAIVYNSRREEFPLEGGWKRRFTLSSSVEYRGRAMLIHEQITAHDFDPENPAVPARLFRTVDSDRVIWVRRSGLETGILPLWERMLQAYGSTQLPVTVSNTDEVPSESAGDFGSGHTDSGHTDSQASGSSSSSSGTDGSDSAP